jgi:protein-S-isoprenylcysteine O-methyltransferase Ste14
MNFVAYTMAMLSAMIGMGSIGVFTVFLYVGPFHLVTLPLDSIEQLLFDAGLCLFFFLQHSGMIRRNVKRQLLRWIPEQYFASVFSVLSGIVLLTLLGFWQASPLLLASAEGSLRWVLRGGFLIVLMLQFWPLFTLNAADLFGIQALVGKPQALGKPQTHSSEQIQLVGPYRWVRHPIYFTSMLLVWLHPDLTADRLLLNILFTLWIFLGTMWEERDLVAIHGETYRTYQRLVPMLIPYRIPKHTINHPGE